MKLLIFTDNHFCETSSIIRRFGTKYPLRLENQISTLNWIESTALQYNCDAVICLGDFFNKPTLTDLELTALQEVTWNNLQHYFIVGNHESSSHGLVYNSTMALNSNIHTIISESGFSLIDNKTQLHFLPYILESDRLELAAYLNKNTDCDKHIIFSHNDIKGLNFGIVTLTSGFDITDIENNCDLFINGHLHNGQKITNKIINVGNCTGQNFSEDATKYAHNIMLLDTDTLEYNLIENPFAFNFYKLEINTKADIKYLSNVKFNSIVSIKCLENLLDDVRAAIDANNYIIEKRISTVKQVLESLNTTETLVDLSVDYLSKFTSFCRERLNEYPLLEAELAEICK